MAIPQHELRFVITFHITTFTPNRPKARGPRITTKAQSELGKTGRRFTSRAAGRGPCFWETVCYSEISINFIKMKRTARRERLGSRTRGLRSRSVRLSTVFFVVGLFAVFSLQFLMLEGFQ